MSAIADQTIDVFLGQLAAKSPTPGGGAAAALTGSVGAALGAMVAEYSLARKSLAEHHAAHAGIRDRMNRARALMLGLATEDADAYAALSDAMRLAKDDPARPGRIGEAALLACRPPAALVATAAEVVREMAALRPIANPMLLSDLAIAADLAAGAARGGVWNVRVNVPMASDARVASEMLREAERAAADAGEQAAAIAEACRAA